MLYIDWNSLWAYVALFRLKEFNWRSFRTYIKTRVKLAEGDLRFGLFLNFRIIEILDKFSTLKHFYGIFMAYKYHIMPFMATKIDKHYQK